MNQFDASWYKWYTGQGHDHIWGQEVIGQSDTSPGVIHFLRS